MMREFDSVFKVGDYIKPRQKSIFCEFEGIGCIIKINRHTYSVKTEDAVRMRPYAVSGVV